MNDENETFSKDDLYKDERDKQISILKGTISNFKRYDKQRTEYYKTVLRKLGQYEAFFEEIKDCDTNADLKIKIFELQKELSRVKILERISDLYSKLPTEKLEEEKTILSLKADIEKLEKKNENLNYIISKLLRKQNEL